MGRPCGTPLSQDAGAGMKIKTTRVRGAGALRPDPSGPEGDVDAPVAVVAVADVEARAHGVLPRDQVAKAPADGEVVLGGAQVAEVFGDSADAPEADQAPAFGHVVTQL